MTSFSRNMESSVISSCWVIVWVTRLIKAADSDSGESLAEGHLRVEPRKGLEKPILQPGQWDSVWEFSNLVFTSHNDYACMTFPRCVF